MVIPPPVFSNDFANFLHIFICVTCGGPARMFKIFKNVSLFELRKPLRHLCSPHGVVFGNSFENFTYFQCYVLETEAKLCKCVVPPLGNNGWHLTCTIVNRNGEAAHVYGCKTY
jgi:hypothetical protein